MRLPTQSVVRFARWCAATLAGFVNFLSGIDVVRKSPVPPSLAREMERAGNSWGDLIGLFLQAVGDGILQLAGLAAANPLMTILAAWWAVETWLLARDLLRWLMTQYGFWRHGLELSQPQVAPPASEIE